MPLSSVFTPVKQHKGTLYENVAKQVEALITNKSLKVGDKLPPERELADIFGVSRTCIREAVKSLSARGFLSIEHGRGVFVREHNISEADVDQILKQILWTSPEDLHSLFEIRRLIEPQGAFWAAQRATEQEIKAISVLVENYRSEDASRINFIKSWETDTKFHLAIVRASHNQVLVRIMESMLDLLADARKQTLQVAHRIVKSGNEHRLISEAIMNRDAAAASQAMLHHLEKVEKELESINASRE